MFPSVSPKQSFPALEVFDEWNLEKKELQSQIQHQKSLPKEEQKKIVYINNREVWYAKLGMNLGSESNWKKNFRRPMLVIKKVGSMFFVAPMTTKGQDNIFHHEIRSATYNLEEYSNIPEISRVQLSQVRIIDRWRFLERIGTISENDFFTIKKKLSELILWASDIHFPDFSGDPEGHL
jgi:mRNA-degrading endonuclease toxin of MazEF toxin-antitoxin module